MEKLGIFEADPDSFLEGFLMVDEVWVIGVNLYTFGVALGPPMLSSAPALVLSAPAITEGCQCMKWSRS